MSSTYLSWLALLSPHMFEEHSPWFTWENIYWYFWGHTNEYKCCSLLTHSITQLTTCHPTPTTYTTLSLSSHLHPNYHLHSTQMALSINLSNIYTSNEDEQKCVLSWIKSHYYRRKLYYQGVVSTYIRCICKFPLTSPQPWQWLAGHWGGMERVARQILVDMSLLILGTRLVST